MCNNFKNCIWFVIGVIASIVIAALAAFGVMILVIVPINLAIIITAASFLFILVSAIFISSKSGCCQKDEKHLCRMMPVIITTIILSIISAIISAVIISVTAVSTTVMAILTFFASVAILFTIFAFIALIAFRAFNCDDNTERSCATVRR